jgi:glyoxylase-like metal-dependent hydrolase (beta-lactamase superfamily II)
LHIESGIHEIRFPIDRGTWGACYLVQGSVPALIDAGMRDTPVRYIRPYLSRLGMTFRDIKVILATHRHLDHTGGIAYLQRQGSFRTLAGEIEAPFLENPWLEVRDRKIRNPRQHVYNGLSETEIEKLLPPPIAVDGCLQDGETLTLGDHRWQIYHTPGHCSGIISLHAPNPGLLLSSDSVQGDGTSGGLAIYDEVPAYLNSIRKIEALKVRKLVVAHPFGPFYKAVFEGRKVTSFLRASRNFPALYEKEIIGIVDRMNGQISLSEIANALRRRHRCDGPRILSLMTVRAHLDLLEGSGASIN